MRRWYHTPGWRALRRQWLQTYPLCQGCQIYPSTDIDHIVRHDGDARRFWDPANLQALCATCHARKTRRGA